MVVSASAVPETYFHFPLPTPNGRSVEIPRGGERGLKSHRFVNESMKLTWNFRRFGESEPTNLSVGGVGRVRIFSGPTHTMYGICTLFPRSCPLIVAT